MSLLTNNTRKQENEILNQSHRLQNLNYINYLYPFETFKSKWIDDIKCSSKGEFKTLSPESKLKQFVFKNSSELSFACKKALSNQRKLKVYQDLIEALPPSQYEDASFLETENNLFKQNIVSPETDISVIIQWSYHGNKREKTFKSDDILPLLKNSRQSVKYSSSQRKDSFLSNV